MLLFGEICLMLVNNIVIIEYFEGMTGQKLCNPAIADKKRIIVLFDCIAELCALDGKINH